MSNNIKKPIKPPFDKDEFKKNASVVQLYIIELLEALCESQGITLDEPD